MDLAGPLGTPRTISHPQGPQSPFGLAPQAPFRKFQGPLALAIAAIVYVLGIVLGSGASVLLVAPSPVANSRSLDSPPGIGDVPVQAPGPDRFKHWALAGALAQCNIFNQAGRAGAAA